MKYFKLDIIQELKCCFFVLGKVWITLCNYKKNLKPELHPWNLTWNPKMEVWKMIFLFKQVFVRFHVNFSGCKWFLFGEISLLNQTVRGDLGGLVAILCPECHALRHLMLAHCLMNMCVVVFWLVVSTHLKKLSNWTSSPNFRVKIQNIFETHHLVLCCAFFALQLLNMKTYYLSTNTLKGGGRFIWERVEYQKTWKETHQHLPKGDVWTLRDGLQAPLIIH